MTTRQEHLEWCKERAREYLKVGDIQNAVASMMSDMNKHPETKISGGILGMLGLHAVASGNLEEAKRYIEGFN